MSVTKKDQALQQEKERSLFVRLPHIIRNKEDVTKLFTGDFKVKLHRQASKCCYVIFDEVEEKMKNLKAVQNIKVNGKSVIVAPAIKKLEKVTKPPKKKIRIPKVKAQVKPTRILFVYNIKSKTQLHELKEVIPGYLSIKMLSTYSKQFRSAMVKMESVQTADEYLKKIREWPVVRGHQLKFKPDTRQRHKKNTSKTLKFYDGNNELYPTAVEEEEN